MIDKICQLTLTVLLCWLGVTWSHEFWNDRKAARAKRYYDEWNMRYDSLYRPSDGYHMTISNSTFYATDTQPAIAFGGATPPAKKKK